MSAFAAGVGMCVLYGKTKAFADALPEIAISVIAGSPCCSGWGFGIFDNGWSHTPRDIYTVVPMLSLVYALSFDRGFARALRCRPGRCSSSANGPMRSISARRRGCSSSAFSSSAYPPDDTLIFGIRFADRIWWPEPFLLLLVCIAWGALLCNAIEIPANRALRQFFAPPKQRGHAAA